MAFERFKSKSAPAQAGETKKRNWREVLDRMDYGHPAKYAANTYGKGVATLVGGAAVVGGLWPLVAIAGAGYCATAFGQAVQRTIAEKVINEPQGAYADTRKSQLFKNTLKHLALPF